MYLLNRRRTGIDIFNRIKFTFHYVSIKSEYSLELGAGQNTFTFHYVSIKSWTEKKEGCDSFGIYIPLCIY